MPNTKETPQPFPFCWGASFIYTFSICIIAVAGWQPSSFPAPADSAAVWRTFELQIRLMSTPLQIKIKTTDIGNNKNKNHHSNCYAHNSYPFFFFLGISSSCIRNIPHAREAPTTDMPVINKYNLSSIPSKIEEMMTAVVIYFAMSSSQLANLSIRFFALSTMQR